jgi:hypothetical protein
MSPFDKGSKECLTENRTTLRVELRRKDSNLRDLFQRQAACHWLTPQKKSAREDLNFRPLGYQPSARPSELRAVKSCDRPGRIRTDDPPLKRRMPWAAWLPACRVKTVAEGLEPTVAALTERCLTSLATPHRQEVAGAGIEPAFGGRLMRPPCPPGHIPAHRLRRRDSNPHLLVYWTSALVSV